MPGLTPHQVSICLDTCLPISPGQSAVIVTDDAHLPIALALSDGVDERGGQAVVIRLPDRVVGQKNAPSPADAAIAAADAVVFALAPEDGCQLWHTRGRAAATDAGARVALLFPPSTWEITSPGLQAIGRLTDTLAELLTVGHEATLTTPAGTDLTFDLTGRRGFSCHSLLTKPGATSTIPEWGDAETSPVEGSANGTLVIDASMTYIGVIDEPIVMRVENGMVTDVQGGEEAARLRQILSAAGPTAYNIAELGIGTVPHTTITGHKDDKVLGTVHVALGHNITLGGNVDAPVHLDAVMWKPTLTIDQSNILSRGALSPPFQLLLDRPEATPE